MDLKSGRSYWLVRDEEHVPVSALREDIDCDVVIVGAGITGALLAFALARSGVDTVVVDRRLPGHGSTAASTALLQYATDTSLTELSEKLGIQRAVACYRLGLRAVESLERICTEIGDSCEFERKHSLYLASSVQDAVALEQEARARENAGLQVEWWSRKRVQSECAFSAPGAIWSAGDGQVNAFRLTQRLLRRAKELGARVYSPTAVTSLEARGSGFELRCARRHRVCCGRVVLAYGYESQAYLKNRVARPSSSFAIASEPIPSLAGWPDRCLLWETARPYAYMRGTSDGRILLGGEDEPGAESHDHALVLQQKRQRLEDRFRALFPGSAWETACAWGGTFAESDDGLPYIGEAPGMPAVWFALGYGGNGITFAMIASEMFVAALAGERHPGTELFGFDRLR